MTDTLDAIRTRHVEVKWPPRVPNVPWCTGCQQPWPCDTATVLAALDEERLGAETEGAAVVLALGAKIVAAEAREARLRDELRDAYIALAALDESYTALATTPEADA